jgi:hypothetical protein
MGFPTRSPVLSHRHVQLNRSSFSLRYTGESSGVSSQLSAQRRPTQRSSSVSDRNHTPNSWASSPHTGHTTFLLCLREEPHTHLMGTPNSWASLSGRLTQSVSWRMSHATVIINTPSQLGRHSPSGQVSHGSTRTSSWL